MPSRIRLLGIALVSTTLAFGTAAFTAEKGARPHRVRLATGVGAHSCALLDNGTVQCWGFNAFGQLGNGTTLSSSSPVTVQNPLGSAVGIAVGSDHSCAIMSNSGAVTCWGINEDGQLGVGDIWLGNGNINESLTPVTVHSLTNIVSLTAGNVHTCAVRSDGTVWCWGNNTRGQLGNGGTLTGSSVPVQVVNVNTAVAVTAGPSHTCALLANGTVECWGGGREGELGNNGIADSSAPVPTFPLSVAPGVGAVEVSAGGTFTCALLSDASVSCWGQNTAGQLGNGTRTSTTVPTRSSLSPTAVALSSGGSHACAILAGGSVSCWGDDMSGALGDGGTTAQPLPVVATGVTGAVEISAGTYYTCAAASNGTIHCWGDNTYGQHGDGSTSPAGTDSVFGIMGTAHARLVAAGNQFTCARRGNGSAACWGAGTSGQLGNSAGNSSPNAVAVTSLTSTIAISAGNGSHACAIDVTGAVQCWGDNSRTQLGNGTATPSNRPVLVSRGIQFTSISAGQLHTCALAVGGTVWCWGAGDRGQLGTGGTFDANIPVQVTGLQNAVAVAAGSAHTCALLVSGAVSCWGDNTANQLGDGSAEPLLLTPQQVSGLQNIVSITAGASHACALPATGSLLCWGSNSRGQIGNNSTTSAPFATAVQGLTNSVAVSAGAFYSCAVRASTIAYCWGANSNSELSAIDTADHPTATPALKDDSRNVLTGVLQIATSTGLRHVLYLGGGTIPQEHTCALMATGGIECWGLNSSGEIGDGTTSNRTRPTAVNSF